MAIDPVEVRPAAEGGGLGKNAGGRGDYPAMSTLCWTVRESLSAALDGEQGPMDPDLADVHLAGCRECRRWRERAETVTRRLRLRPVEDDPAAPRALRAAVADTPPSRVPAAAMLLAVRRRPPPGGSNGDRG